MSNSSKFTRDEHFMRLALKQAQKSFGSGDVPVGAIIVHDDKVIGRGHNKIELQGNSLYHAELIAIQAAIKKMKYKHLLGAELYVTLEPCAMCAGAIVLARISRVVYGAADPKAGAVRSLFSITQDSRLNHRCDVLGGVMEEECSKMLKDFFASIRENKKNK